MAVERVEKFGCTCTWEQPPEDVVPLDAGIWVLSAWDPGCPFDGEDTDQHRQLQARARELAIELGVLD